MRPAQVDGDTNGPKEKDAQLRQLDDWLAHQSRINRAEPHGAQAVEYGKEQVCAGDEPRRQLTLWYPDKEPGPGAAEQERPVEKHESVSSAAYQLRFHYRIHCRLSPIIRPFAHPAEGGRSRMRHCPVKLVWHPVAWQTSV